MKTETIAIAFLSELWEENHRCPDPCRSSPVGEIWARTEAKLSAAIPDDVRIRAIAFLDENHCLSRVEFSGGEVKILISELGPAFLSEFNEREKREVTEERRHREIMRVAKVSAWIAAASAIVALLSAWFSKLQADSAALSARAMSPTTMQPAAPPMPQQQPSNSAPAPSGTAKPLPSTQQKR